MGGRRTRVVAADFVMSVMWVWSGVLVRMLAFTITTAFGFFGFGSEIVKASLSIANMFFFAFLAEATRGGAYNPLTVFSAAISGDFSNFLYCVAARIPSQEKIQS